METLGNEHRSTGRAPDRPWWRVVVAVAALGASGVVLGPSPAEGGPAPRNGTLVSDVDALRALRPPADGTWVVLAHHSSPLDQGGGRFVFDAASELADDDGTVIEPDPYVPGPNEHPTTTPPDPPGRWRRAVEDAGTVSVMWFGAQGDGATNDRCAIDRAIAAAGEGGTVVFPRPTWGYRLAADPACPGPGAVVIDHAVTLRGEGARPEGDLGEVQTRLALGDWVGGALVPTYGEPNIHLEGRTGPGSVVDGGVVNLEGLRLQHGSHGIHTDARIVGDHSTWRDVVIQDAKTAGIAFAPGSDAQRLLVEQLSVSDAGSGITSHGVFPEKRAAPGTCAEPFLMDEEPGDFTRPVAHRTTHGIVARDAALHGARFEKTRITGTRLAAVRLVNENPTARYHVAFEMFVAEQNLGAGIEVQGQIDVHLEDAHLEGNGIEHGRADVVTLGPAGPAIARVSLEESTLSVPSVCQSERVVPRCTQDPEVACAGRVRVDLDATRTTLALDGLAANSADQVDASLPAGSPPDFRLVQGTFHRGGPAIVAAPAGFCASRVQFFPTPPACAEAP